MLLVFTAELPALDPKNAPQLLQTFEQFNASLRVRKEGGFYLTVPSHRVPLRTSRLIKEFCRSNQFDHFKWRLFGLDDEGNPTVPITEETP